MSAFLESEFETLVYWITARERIRRLKEAGAPKPWTNDALLRDFRWCNVSRATDRVSIELMRDWYSDDDSRTQLTAAALGRLINWPEALLDANDGAPFRLGDLPKLRPRLHARAASGRKIFTGAYVIPGIPGMNKIDSILDMVERISANAHQIVGSTLRSTWSNLTELDGIGSFLAGQIAADLVWLHTGRDWPDATTWAPVGPGSERGMNRLRGRPVNQKIPQDRFDVELAEYIETMTPRVREIAISVNLGAQDWQSTLCEFSKLRKLQLGEGTVRARYDGKPAVVEAPKAQAELFLT